ncbi:hypothetical protein [Dyella acidisoli]|uniref:HNH endonuclease n=1 Tax=Dyella acidisoli TaxID=1867834 RepID=A0ABQ5XHS9_9GAMM|nr:hypothetical protein [Dyella acidisoli]GLQ91203.1 hypothetical protein GCM10007901_01530 [Dyella acidisoli]
MPSHKKGETHSKTLVRKARSHGARFRSNLVNLNTLERKKVSWLSKSILYKMGVPAKPKWGSICPSCGKKGDSFELDHMGPWRQYIAAVAGPHISKGGIIKIRHVRMLYNDPHNLWWICKKCNGKKSDFISEDGSVPMSGVKGRNVKLKSIIG